MFGAADTLNAPNGNASVAYVGKRAVQLPSGLSEFPLGSGRGRHARGDASRLAPPSPGEGTGWGSPGAGEQAALC